MRYYVLVVLVLVVSTMMLLDKQQQVEANNAKRLREFRELFATARQLESAQMLMQTDDSTLDKRKQLLFSFAREPKSSVAGKNHQELLKLVNEYRIKAQQYVQECRKQNGNWFTKVLGGFGGPLGSMKGLSKSDSFLSSLTERYESQCKTVAVTEQLVDQDLAKFQMRGLDMILFVLATDLKYLVTENVQILNGAIYHALKEDKFISNNNFYDVDELSANQRRLLMEFYSSRVDPDAIRLGDAVEHFSEPSSLVIGRLLDSCHAVQDYRHEWRQLLDSCGPIACEPGNEFTNKHQLERYDDIGTFCDQFLDAL